MDSLRELTIERLDREGDDLDPRFEVTPAPEDRYEELLGYNRLGSIWCLACADGKTVAGSYSGLCSDHATELDGLEQADRSLEGSVCPASGEDHCWHAPGTLELIDYVGMAEVITDVFYDQKASTYLASKLAEHAAEALRPRFTYSNDQYECCGCGSSPGGTE